MGQITTTGGDIRNWSKQKLIEELRLRLNCEKSGVRRREELEGDSMTHALIKFLPHDSDLLCNSFAEDSSECNHWHLLDDSHGERSAMLCTGFCTEEMEEGKERITKDVKRGGITCPDCLERLKYYKAVKL